MLIAGQKRFATILSCADSRLVFEWPHDTSIGELFVVRVVSNVAGPENNGSLEYAVELSRPMVPIDLACFNRSHLSVRISARRGAWKGFSNVKPKQTPDDHDMKFSAKYLGFSAHTDWSYSNLITVSTPVDSNVRIDFGEGVYEQRIDQRSGSRSKAAHRLRTLVRRFWSASRLVFHRGPDQ